MEAEECDTNLALSIGGGGGRRIHDCKSEKQAKQLQEEDDDDGDEKYSIRKRGSKPRSEDMEAANNFDAKERGGGRKKLKLGKEQIALLEGSFTEHNTLNPVSTYTCKCFGIKGDVIWSIHLLDADAEARTSHPA